MNEIGSIFEVRALDALRAVGRIFSEQDVDLALLFGVVNFQSFKHAHRKHRLAVRIDDIALQPANHDAVELFLVRHDCPGEPLIIQQFQQRGKGLLVSVVGCSTQKQPMGKVWSE